MLKRFYDTNLFQDSVLLNCIYVVVKCLQLLLKSKGSLAPVFFFRRYRTSDRLCLIGAGNTAAELTSLNDMSAQSDFLALSYAIFLPVQLNYFFLETPHKHEISFVCEQKRQTIPFSIERYNRNEVASLIWKNSEAHLIDNHIAKPPYKSVLVCPILSDRPAVISILFKMQKALQLDKLFLLQKGGSLIAVTNFAQALGYKEVLFIGFDLNSSKYFFVNNPSFSHLDLLNPKEFDLDGQPINESQTELSHDNSRDLGLPLLDVFGAFVGSKSPKCRMFVSSAKSELSNYLPVRPLKRFLDESDVV